MQKKRLLASIVATGAAALTILAGTALASSLRGGTSGLSPAFATNSAPLAQETVTPATGQSGSMMGGATGEGMATGSMMAGNAMGQMMGAAMANAPGGRVSAADAGKLGNATPSGATVDQAINTISFQTTNVRLTVLASPSDGPDMTFRIAGLTDPTITVPQGATVTVQLIDADSDTSHGWLLTQAQPPFPSMAMMQAPIAFPGSFAMPLGEPTAAGMHSETISFTAATAGHYTYLCPVAGHAQQGMYGAFSVTSS